MTTKEKELQEAHQQDIRISAICVEQIMGTEGCKSSPLMHYVCQECGSEPTSDVCGFQIEENNWDNGSLLVL